MQERVKRLLLVDDHEDQRSQISTVLQSAGYTVTEATTGDTALLKRYLGNLSFDMVILSKGAWDAEDIARSS